MLQKITELQNSDIDLFYIGDNDKLGINGQSYIQVNKQISIFVQDNYQILQFQHQSQSMGNSAPLQFAKLHFPPNIYNWRPFSTQSGNNISDSQKLIIDQFTRIIAQKYSIRKFSSLQFELNSFLFRKQHSQNIVTVYDILLAQTPSVIVPDCMVNQHNKSFTVILQRIPYRLADIGIIKFEQMTYILEQSFNGLQVLFTHFGKNFLIDEDLICFNTEGKCKIWINQNLSKNTPNLDAIFTQQTIIQQIFQTLESRLDSQPPEYYSKTKKKSVLSEFSHVINFIQKIRKKMQIQTNSIESIKSSETIKKSDSDSVKTVNKGRSKGKGSEEKRVDKFSLKNYRNNQGNKSIKPPKTILSRQQTTEVSILDLEKRNIEQMQMSIFFRSSFKSVSNPQKKKSIQFTQYSEKIKRKKSAKKQSQNDKMEFNKGKELYGKFPKGPLFSRGSSEY